MKTRFHVALSALCCASLLAPCGIRAETFAEPFTTFYGKVVERGTRQMHLIQQGDLVWTISRSDGTDAVLKSTLFRLKDGEYSYRIDVPHDAVALGLTPNQGFPSLPMKTAAETHAHLLISVDGRTATPVGPAGVTFEVSQQMRAAAYRLDLEVATDWLDTDGDGMPDWWEDANGLDKQNPADAALDADSDGVSNRNEYLQGLNPTRDNRVPLLNTSYLVAYADGLTGFILDVIDTDSAASQLVYTVTSLPSRGEMYLRCGVTNSATPDRQLQAGDTFTQADVQQGRILFTYNEQSLDPMQVGLRLVDENPAHAAVVADLPLYLYRPGNVLLGAAQGADPSRLSGGAALAAATFAGDEQKLRNYLLSSLGGYVIRDGAASERALNLSAPSSLFSPTAYADQFVPNFGRDRGQVLVGGSGNDVLTGGMENDVLIGGAGTNSLRGNAGADWFVFTDTAAGLDTIQDFSVAEGDVIDLSRLVVGSNEYVESYLRLDVGVTSAPVLRVDASGKGIAYTNLAIVVTGLSSNDANLGHLVEDGRIVVAGRKAHPQVTIAVLSSPASENGPTDGSFVLTRSGDISGPLTVNIQVGGSAVNGTDYSSIGNTISFPAGVRQVVQKVSPFADSATETAETVEIVVLSGTGYTVGILDRASLTITDLAMLITVEALEPLAVKDTLSPGVFLISRDALIDRSVLVRFTLSGTATAGTDYQSIVAYANMVPYQTTALVQITPLAGAVITGPAESIILSLKADTAYTIGTTNRALINLVEHADTLDTWKNRWFPGFSGTLEEFAQADSGNTGIKNMLRYAFGLDPTTPQASRMPRFYLQDGRWTVDVYRNPGALDVDVRVRSFSDLMNREGTLEDADDVTSELGGTNAAAMRFRAKSRTNDPVRAFMSIEVLKK